MPLILGGFDPAECLITVRFLTVLNAPASEGFDNAYCLINWQILTVLPA
jgi:hypothetical protein